MPISPSLDHVDRTRFPHPRGGQARPFVWAHRGASALEPENTLQAFATAVALGADGIELDIQLTKDAVPIVIHDPRLWTDGNELILRRLDDDTRLRPLWVRDLTWSELAGVPVVQVDGSRTPLARFEEVLDTVPAWLWLDVELKAGWTFDERLAEVFCTCVKRRPERVLASSFDHLMLRAVGKTEPALPLLAILHARPVDLPGLLCTIPAAMTSIDRPFLTAEDVRSWSDAGVVVGIGGRELVDDLATVLSWPVASVFLDDPRLALQKDVAGAGSPTDPNH